MGDLGQALRTDFPVAGRPHTFGLPTIYRWRKVASHQLTGRRIAPILSQIYVRGGAHLTNSALLVTRILKELTATEDVFYSGYVNIDYLFLLTEEDANSEQAKLYRMEGQACWAANRDPVESATDILPRPPWWLACNPARFPYWYNRSEPRNRDLVAALQGAKDSMVVGDESYSHLPGGTLAGEGGHQGQQKVIIAYKPTGIFITIFIHYCQLVRKLFSREIGIDSAGGGPDPKSGRLKCSVWVV
jgi:hypothetical protein